MALDPFSPEYDAAMDRRAAEEDARIAEDQAAGDSVRAEMARYTPRVRPGMAPLRSWRLSSHCQLSTGSRRCPRPSSLRSERHSCHCQPCQRSGSLQLNRLRRSMMCRPSS